MKDRPKLALVTGGAGFIGSRLAARLLREGYRVISLDNYFAGSRASHVVGVEYREGHTKDIARHIPERPDIIFHLGEYARVEQSVLEPEIVEDLNTVGTRGVLEFWKARGGKLVYAGSSTKFGDGGKTRETSPYARTKARNSELVRAYGEREGLPWAIAYFYNVYGPGERAGVYGTVIENFKQQYLRGTPITVTAPGTQRRNFTHVDDIVDGLLLIGEGGEGDEFGLGNEEAFSILDVARMFGTEIVMLPERRGNRTSSGLDTSKARALGWTAKRSLRSYIEEFARKNPKVAPTEKRVLVFSTTFHPVSGPAEDALLELVHSMPNIRFDIVTAAFSKEALAAQSPVSNAVIHHVGFGSSLDKYLLPLFGYRRARTLHREHGYLFTWSLMASYGTLAAVLLRRRKKLPLLITLADQRLERLSALKRLFLAFIFGDADQVYAGDAIQEAHAATIAGAALRRNSIGDGDAFANQLRFVYSDILDRGRANSDLS